MVLATSPMQKHDAHYVDSPRKLEALLSTLRQQDTVGLDTEFVSEGRYTALLCLVQLATAEEIWIIDPLAVPDLREMWRLLAAPGCEVLTVAARHEILFFVDAIGGPPARLLDLQIAAGLMGYGYPLSHTNLVKRILGIEIHAGETYSDWRRRPLTASQLRYAADDVHYLLSIRERLLEEAEQRKRVEWIRDECDHLVASVAAGEEKWRVAGSGRLGRRELAILRELWRWRDAEARHANAPAARILRDDLLVEIARRAPRDVSAFESLRGLDHNWLRTHSAKIRAVLQKALELPASEWPSFERREDPPQVAVLTKLLAVAAANLATQYEVDPALLATTADLQQVVRWKLNPERERMPDVLRGWRGDILSEPLQGLLDGKRMLRVEDFTQKAPLSFDEWPLKREKAHSSEIQLVSHPRRES
jgi:ribonuclease D